MPLGMKIASRSAIVICLVLLLPLMWVGCSSLSGTARTSSTAPASSVAAQKAIESALDHMRAATDIRDDINHQLDLCDEAYDIAEPDRATSYAEAAQGLLPQHDVEQSTAKRLLMSVEATDASEDSKKHALLLLDWVESRIAEAATLSECIAAMKVVAAAGASLTEAQVNDKYRLRLELLELHRTANERVTTANDFSGVQQVGASSTTMPASEALLIGYEYQLQTVRAWREAVVTLWNLKTYKYNATGPNRSIEPSDLVVKDLETLVARIKELPAPPSGLAAADSAWRSRVDQLLKAERALAQKDTHKNREDRAWLKDKEYAALNELVDATAQQIALISTTPAAPQTAATTETTTTATQTSELSPGLQGYLDKLSQLGQRYWDMRVTLDFETSGPNYPVNKQVIELYTALVTSVKKLSVPNADPELARLKEDFMGACQNVLKRQNLEDAALSQIASGGGDIKELSDKYASARAAGEDSDADFRAFRAGLEAQGIDCSWVKQP